MILFYGNATAKGNFENWNKVLPRGYVAGETLGNLIVGSHLFLAAIIIIGGPLQLTPQLRKYAPVFHKWNGYLYILTAIILSLSGLYMVWIRGSIGGLIQHFSISINAILIMIAAIFAVKYAIIRDIKNHRIWAIRLFLVVNGVWFFRVGLYFWLFINQKPVGFNPYTFEGPFLYFLTFSQYTLPLAIFELYLKANKSSKKWLLQIATFVIFIFTMLMLIGIFAASVDLWFPKMNE
ncbi:DUF2306 domain-containing protein [Sediminibacterium sp.]|uniref:DUF2306 domain-containing protein n=1 Tax=Sediminibacterium sp. TaxID=1917865 RepID=UPI003F71CCFF